MVETTQVTKYILPTENEDQKDKPYHEVDTAIRTSGVLFVHSVLPYAVPEGASVIRHGVPWQTKLKLLLVRRPDIATSFITEGDDERHMVGRFGVLITGGNMTGIAKHDVGSIAHSDGNRTAFSQSNNNEIVRRQFLDALKDRLRFKDRPNDNQNPGDTYNEVTIHACNVGPIYICIDKPLNMYMRSDQPPSNEVIKDICNWQQGRYYDTPPHEQINQFSKDMGGYPVVILLAGKAYRSEYDSPNKQYIPTTLLTREEILKMSYCLSDELRARLLLQLYEEQPLRSEKIAHPDKVVINAFLEGQDNALALMIYGNPEKYSSFDLAQKMEEQIDKPYRPLHNGNLGKIMNFNNTAVCVGSTWSDGHPSRYMLTRATSGSYQLYKTIEYPNFFTVVPIDNISSTVYPIPSDPIQICIGNIIIESPHLFPTISKYMDFCISLLNTDDVQFNIIITAHIYGIASYLKNSSLSDHEPVETDLVKRITDNVDISYVQRIIEKRLGEKNNFKLTQDELLYS